MYQKICSPFTFCVLSVLYVLFIANGRFAFFFATVGSLKLHMCPVERYIPIYLIVGGSFGILRNSGSLIKKLYCQKKGSEENSSDIATIIDSLISCFMLAWFIAGRSAYNH